MASQSWEKFGELKLSTGRLWVGDAHYATEPEDGLIVDLPKGDYEAFTLAVEPDPGEIQWGGDRIARFRVCRHGVEPELGGRIGETYSHRGSREIGEVWAHVAVQGVCDAEGFHGALPKSDKAYWKLAEPVLVDLATTGELDLEGDAKLLIVSAGEEVGTYAVHQLVADGESCGLEVVLVEMAISRRPT